jgi:uncharacterized protein YbjT (DUF2867 family)
MTKIMLVGATGMVGQAVLDHAVPGRIAALARRNLKGPALVAPIEQWPEIIGTEAPDVLISCLGTTIKAAKSQTAFRAVDYDLALAAARAAKSAGGRQMIAVSSVGASVASGSFYLRTKGELEQSLQDLGFEHLDILRPGLLIGDRSGPARIGEALAMRAAPVTDALLHGSMRKYRSISATTVAKAILALTEKGSSGTFIYEHDAILALAD